MNNIFNFLEKVWIDLKETQKLNNFFWPFLLLVITITLPLGVNNVALGIFILFFFLILKSYRLKILGR